MSRSCSFLLLSVLSSSIFGAHPQGQHLRWRSGRELEEPGEATRPSRSELVWRLRQGSARHVLVRFERGPACHERELWSAAGVELGRALGGGAFFARLEPSRLDARIALLMRGLVDVREIELEWKLHPALLAGETPQWTVVSRDGEGRTTVVVHVLLQAGVPLERGEELLGRLGGRSHDRLESVNGLVALLPRARVAELAAQDAVAWVEPAMPRWEETAHAGPAGPARNDSSRVLVQANVLQAPPYGLDGSGVKVLVYDADAPRASHLDFGGRLTSHNGDGGAHSTHVAAIIGGDGSGSVGRYRGMAPGVTMEAYSNQFSVPGQLLVDNPGDLESDYAAALAQGAALANNSIGSLIEFIGDCALQGDYCVTDALIDAIVRGSLGAPCHIVWAAGNERGGSRCDVEGFGDYYSISPPATAKNHITVGAVNSDDGSMTSFSSWGPTDDGRLKPDVCAPGCQAGADGGVTSAGVASDGAYATLCGTSMASPTACGIAALLLQDYRLRFGGPDPLGSTLKACLTHTAQDRGNAGPDYQFGFGLVRGQDAVDFMRLGQFLEDSVAETGASRSWSLVVPAGASELRLTLAWDDVPAQPNVLGSLVNDLDLVVRDPLGTQHAVWTLDPGAPAVPAAQTQADHRNNIEQVLVPLPMAGTWTVEVTGFDVPQGPQTFSLVSSRALGTEPRLEFSFPDGAPVLLAPGVATSVLVGIEGVDETVVPGSPVLHVRYDAGAFLIFPMSALGDDLYEARLPPPACGATPEYFFGATGLASGPATSPPNAPMNVRQALVHELAPLFDDDFETDRGWTVSSMNLFGGAWERGTPLGGGVRGDPPTANGASGQCYLTGNAPGNADVDFGPTWLVSPRFDLSSGGAEISFARWFTNDDGDDALTVEVSDDDGASWYTVETVHGGPIGSWVRDAFLLDDFLAPTGQVRVRFGVRDTPDNSITEAGLDDFRIVVRACSAHRDCDGNGILDADDIAAGRALDANGNGVPDGCEPKLQGKARSNPTRPSGL